MGSRLPKLFAVKKPIKAKMIRNSLPIQDVYLEIRISIRENDVPSYT